MKITKLLFSALNPWLKNGLAIKIRHAFPSPFLILQSLNRPQSADLECNQDDQIVLIGLGTAALTCLQQLKSEGFRNVEKMPLGFDASWFYPDEKKREALRAKLGLNRHVIAYFGRLTKEKGVHILIQALEGLKDLEWLLMMDDFDEYSSGYTSEIKSLIDKAGIKARVVFISPSHYEIAAYMNAADIVVVPSVSSPQWKEQYGRVAAEALACGAKVIASNSGALPELLNGQGWIFPEGDIEALGYLIKMKLDDNINLNDHKHKTALYAKTNLSIICQKRIIESVFKK